MRNPTEPHCFQLNLSASNLDFTVSDISRRKSATGEPEILYCYGILNMFWSWGFCSLHELADHTITMDHLRAYPLIDFDTTLNTIIRCLHFYGLLKYICKLMKYWGLGFFSESNAIIVFSPSQEVSITLQPTLSRCNWSAEHAREAVCWASPGLSHGTRFLRWKSGGHLSPWSSFFNITLQISKLL